MQNISVKISDNLYKNRYPNNISAVDQEFSEVWAGKNTRICLLDIPFAECCPGVF